MINVAPKIQLSVLLTCILLSLTVKIVYTQLFVGWTTPPRFDESSGDAYFYETLAQNLYDGKGYTYDRVTPTADKLPLYPIFISLIYHLTGRENFATVRLAQLLLAGFVPLFVFSIGKNLFSPLVGLLAAGFIAIDPLMTYFAPAFLAETFYLVLVLIGVWFVTKSQKEFRWCWWMLASFCFGLAMVTRGNMVVLPIVLFLGACLRWGRQGVLRGAIMFGMIGLVWMPWVIRNYMIMGALIPFTTNGGSAFYGGNNRYAEGNWLQTERQGDLERPKSTGELAKDREYYALGLQWISENPDDYAILLFKKIFRLFDPDPHTTRSNVSTLYRVGGWIPYGVLLPFILLGMFALLPNRNIWIVYSVMISVLANTLIIYGDSRFRAPIQPYLYLFGAWGLLVVLNQILTQINSHRWTREVP